MQFLVLHFFDGVVHKSAYSLRDCRAVLVWITPNWSHCDNNGFTR